MRLWTTLGALAAAWAGSLPAGADVLFEQTLDYVDRLVSYHKPEGWQGGDDYWIDEPVVVQSATFCMVATWPNTPWNYSFGIHRGWYGGRYDFGPTVPPMFRMFNPSSVTDLGEWPDEPNLHLFEVRFDNVNVLLEPYLNDEHAFWFSCAGHLLNYVGGDRCYWATAGDGEIFGHPAYLKDDPPVTGWARTGGVIPATDFAMRIEGVPASEYRPTTELTDYRLEWGRHVEGDIDSLRVAGDDDVLQLRCVGRGPGPYRRAIVDTTFQCHIENPDLLDVSSHGSIAVAGTGYAVFYLRNRDTGSFEEVGRHYAWSYFFCWPIRDIPAASYVAEDGRIDLRVEYHAEFYPPGSRLSRTDPAAIDRITIDARYAN